MAELIGRADLLDGVCSAVTGGRGALVLGGSGMGKTAVLKAVAKRLDEEFHTLYIRGTALSAETPYGALAFLVGGLPEKTVGDPLQLLRELDRYLAARAGGRRILLAVDNADRLDRFSSMVLSQLLRRGSVAIAAAASAHWEAGFELMDLWSEGLLARFDLEPLTERQTRQMMQQILGGAVSSLAAGTMWREAEGSPRFIRLLTEAQVSSGTLVRRGLVWVRTGAFAWTGDVGEVVDTVLGRLAPLERRLVQILALARSLPLPVVLDLVPAAVVDALEERQVIRVDPQNGVRFAGGNVGTVIAAAMPPGRKRELWEDVSARIAPQEMAPSELYAYVAWSLACGEAPVPVPVLESAAAAANTGADPLHALELVRTVPAGERTPGLVLEEARALDALGDPEGVIRVVQEAGARIEGGDRAGYVQLMLLYASSLARTAGGDPDEVLAGVGRSAECNDPDSAAALAIARTALALDYRGAPEAEALAQLGAVVRDPRLGPETRTQARALYANALALTGRSSEALAAVAAMGRPEGYSLSRGNAAEVCTRVFDTYILAGDLVQAAAFVRAFDESGIRPSYQGSAGELAVALLAVWQGQDGTAKEALTGSIGQLSVHDPQEMLPLARTLAGFVHLNPGHAPEAAGHLPATGTPRFREPYFRRFQRRYFDLLSEGAVPAERCRALREEAAAALAIGYSAPACLLYAAALRSRDKAAAAALLEAGDRMQGRFAELVSRYAAGTLNDDPALLLEAAKGFSDLGQYPLCQDAARAAADLLAAGGTDDERGLGRTAKTLVNLSMRRMKHIGGRAETLSELSGFEADLAYRAVTMATTSQIAKELNLSPRTIEWHLGKIFAKLHVSGRAELAEVLA